MIRILYLIDRLDSGGTEKQLVQLIEKLDKSVFAPHLCTLKSSGGLLDELDVPGTCLSFTSLTNASVIAAIFRLVVYIRKHQIQVVQTFFQDPFVLAAMTRVFHGAKLVGSFRDLGFWRTKKESMKNRFAACFFDAYIANSKAVKEHFVDCDDINPDKVTVIYNGFDMNKLHIVNELNSKKDSSAPPLIGIVANLNRSVKRVEDFIAVAAEVHKQRADAHFVIIGDGHLRPQLENLTATLNLSQVVEFVGSIPDPLSYVKRFSVGFNTSETEGFPNAVIEYMACGVPVIATDSGGTKELVRHGENGFLTPVGDIKQMAEKAIELLDGNVNRRISDNNRQAIRDKFSNELMLQRYQDFYLNLIEKSDSHFSCG